LDDIAVTAAAPKEGTVKTLTIASGGQFTVGEGVKVNSVDTSGVGQHGAETGIYRLSGDADAKTLTLKRYDVDGETLMGSETISNKEALGSGRYRTLEFAQMGGGYDSAAERDPHDRPLGFVFRLGECHAKVIPCPP
ncbi:MAG: hypothetical protein EBU57_10540, partial [Alphaproteobacteria bacterium]|nr:hypothetical protein [Alphaproteobacteria bacterium]